MKPITRNLWVLVFGLCLAPAVQGQQDRITAPIEASRTVVLDSRVAPLALAQRGDEGAVEPSRQLPWITLLFKRTPAQEDALTRLLTEQQDRSSPNYHQWLSSGEFADRFGLSQNDVEKIAAWLRDQGFHVAYTARDRDFIAFGGTAGQVRNKFHTEIHRYTIDGEPHIMNATAASVPAALASVVREIQGLNDVRMKPGVLRGKPAGPVADRPDYTHLGAHYLAPDDIATIYDITALYNQGLDGSGQSMVVVGQSNVDLADLQQFRTEFNLPGGDPQIVECCAADPGETGGDSEEEADLDLEWTSAVARNANIIFVYSTTTAVAVQYAIDQDFAPVISESSGECEAAVTALGFAPSFFEDMARTANAKGITWLAASGDEGAAGCDVDTSLEASHGLAVQLPSSVPEVTAVGGTEFNEGSGTYWSATNNANFESATGYIPEKAWDDTTVLRLSAGGGGVSTLYSKPPWQTGPGVPDDGMRDVPDVSLTASPEHDPYVIYDHDFAAGFISVGGTSAATPVMAGIVVLLNQSLAAAAQPPAGNINPALYALAQTGSTVTHTSSTIFNDITTGSNEVFCVTGSPDCVDNVEGYLAAAGYDRATGLGSVDAFNLVMAYSPAMFNDVPSSATYFQAANLMFDYGVTTGCVESSDPAARSYCPDDNVTRQEMAAFIVRAVTGTVTPAIYNTTPYFQDVPDTNNFFPHIQKMMDLGITTGCSQNPPLFCPTNTIPRWEMAIFMIRARLMLYGASFTTSSTPYFADVPTNVEGNGQPFPFIQRAYEEHVTNGCGTSPLVYCPDELVTRGQMASFIMRALFNQTTILGPTAPVVTGVSPSAVAATSGSQIAVTITGANTNFQSGDTVTVPSGMLTVSDVAVNSTTSIAATLTVNGNAVAGPQALVVTSGGQNLALPLAIQVGTY
ncbi:MAG: S53 family peptidase [Bryobacteraceae bacterium]